MLQEYKGKTNLFVGLGLVINILAMYVLPRYVGAGIVLPVLLVGTALFIAGCCFYATGKGHHGAWGVLGLFSIIGLLVLICMTDKHKN